MQTKVQDIVSSKFLEIVEQLTFMFGEPVAKSELPLDDCELSLAGMGFNGDLEGTLTISVPKEIMAEIAANILGLDADDIESDEMMNDALMEMLNVVCGHLIMGIVGNDANFKLITPHIEDVSEEAVAAMVDSDDYIGFLLEDSPVLLGLHLES